jgi:tRNA (guanine37-N1)-methyltransferase
MKFKIFTLFPQIFESFLSTSLIARGVSKSIISVDLINWREKYGVGGYNQIDDKPFGGGNGMVLQAEPIFKALEEHNLVSSLYTPRDQTLPNNSDFFEAWKAAPTQHRRVTISLTPRGYPLTQQTCEWLAANFDEIGILCGRYEGFDHRIDAAVDLELSLGNYVLNGGEVAAMSLVESVSRLVPGYITKGETVLHDSWSSELNSYHESSEFVIGANKIKQKPALVHKKTTKIQNPFDNQVWKSFILPNIEHPQYTRPEIWREVGIPSILMTGDHKKIQNWRLNWWK